MHAQEDMKWPCGLPLVDPEVLPKQERKAWLNVEEFSTAWSHMHTEPLSKDWEIFFPRI
jgi:hypothetical protein